MAANDIIRKGRFEVGVPSSSANLGPGLDCLGLALDLKLRFRAEVGTETTRISRPPDPFGERIEPDNDFLLYGFQKSLELWGYSPPDVTIEVLEQPPLGRGLGSKAAALVGGAALAEALMWTPVGRWEVARTASSIGGNPNNVCASALGGLVITATDSQGRLMLRALQINPMWKLAVAVPELPEQIEKARKVLPVMVPLSSAIANMGRGFLLVHALLLGDVQPFRDFLEDQLHEPFRKTLIPGFESVKAAAMEAGAAGVFISGSGSAVAAFVSSGVEKVADRMVEAFAGEGLNALPLTLSVDRRGYQVERI